MQQVLRNAAFFATIILIAVCLTGKADRPVEEFLSPLDVVADNEGKTLYVLEATAGRVAVFEVQTNKVAKTISLPDSLTGLDIAPDGSRLYLTGGDGQGALYVLNLKTGTVDRTISAGHTPVGPVVSPDGKTLCLCNRFEHSVSVFDPDTGGKLAEIRVTREPVAAAFAADGRQLFVANHLPAGPADADYAAAVVSVLDLGSNKTVQTITLPNGSTGLNDICLSPDGRHAYVSHILARYQLPTTQLERGWMNTNALSIIDARTHKLINTVLLDDVDLGAANPWGLACTRDGRYLCISHAGTHEISVIDREKLHAKLDKVAGGQKVSDVSLTPDDVPNDLSFLVGIRRRIKLSGNGPRGLAMIGTRAYVAEYFTDSLGLVDIDPQTRPVPQSLPLGPDRLLTTVRKGEMLFHDADLCFQHWQSCGSCHPGHARADALNWDLLNDGIGNPKNTKSLLLSHKTPPAMITGARPDAEAAVRAGISHIQFAVRPEEDAAAIDEYLKSLKPLPSPYLVEGRLSQAAERGKKTFESAGCSSCHTPPLYTDLGQYNIGTGKNLDKDRSFDTPMLLEVWRSAPYMHDGRAATIRQVLKRNPDDKHGHTSNLTDEQINDLAEFVLSL